jgi:hypothetical protein
VWVYGYDERMARADVRTTDFTLGRMLGHSMDDFN